MARARELCANARPLLATADDHVPLGCIQQLMRIRTIKPDFYKHEGLFELEAQTKLPIRLAYTGLWCACDVRGRFKWRERQLKIEILPYDQVDFGVLLDALVAGGYIAKYKVGEEWFGCVLSFEKHQRIGGKEAQNESLLPPPPRKQIRGSTGEAPGKHPDTETEPLGKQQGSTGEAPVKHLGMQEGKGREGKGMEGNGKEHVPVADAPPVVKSSVTIASEILEHLNVKASREFRLTTPNIKLVSLRLEEVGGDADGVKVMIDRMCAKWKTDPKMSEFLRPETLFNKTKFSGYYDMRNLPVQSDSLSLAPGRELSNHDNGFDPEMEEFDPEKHGINAKKP